MSLPDMFALIDCNNFYVSCERLFRPDLRDKPVIVLSNNDGCVIARSNEARALGIAMGVPFFQIKAFCRQHHVKVFSSNYALYGDLSQRVMSTIDEYWPHVEIYSIDEAFLDLSTMPENTQEDFCRRLHEKILKNTGIPTSIGIGATKTLAKAANHFCKKVLKIPVFNLTGKRDCWLKQMDVGDIWGVGRQWSLKLKGLGIQTAHDLATFNPHILRKKSSVMLMRTALELQGISCGGLGEVEVNKSIIASRSFGAMQTEFSLIAQAISGHCARAVEKMRSQNLAAKSMSIFIQTNRHRDDLAQHNRSVEMAFVYPESDLRIITAFAKQGLKQIFREGYFYKKAGICLMELMPKNRIQHDLFYPFDAMEREHSEQFMTLMDGINQRFGSRAIFLAAEGCEKPFAIQRQMKSPSFTTRWAELAEARL